MKLSRLLNQTAVYWAPNGNDGYGKPNFVSGVEITVRWEDVKRYYVSGEGEEKLSNSTVISTSQMQEGGYLFLGSLDDLNSASQEDPIEEDDAFYIKNSGQVPDVSGSTILYEAML